MIMRRPTNYYVGIIINTRFITLVGKWCAREYNTSDGIVVGKVTRLCFDKG